MANFARANLTTLKKTASYYLVQWPTLSPAIW